MITARQARTRAIALAAVGLGGLALASCGSQHSTATASAASTAPTSSPTIDQYVAKAQRVFTTETSGPPTIRLFDQVVTDPHLLALLHAGNDAAAFRYATIEFKTKWAPEHMALLRFSSDGRTVLRLGVPWVVSPMPTRTVTRPGHAPITIEVAEQDVIGFVRAMHNKHPQVQVVARDPTGHQHALSLLGPAANATLPTTGFVTIRGVRYQVRSFRRTSFAQGVLPLHIWILKPTT